MPKPLGIGRTFNMGFILMTDGGSPISKEDLKDTATVTALQNLVSQFHNAGFVHGDLHPGNVVLRGSKQTLIDLRNTMPASPSGIEKDLLDLSMMISN